MQLLCMTMTLIGAWTSNDVMWRGGLFPPCIIITWSEFVFWGCIWVSVVVFNYQVPFSIFRLHAFSCLVQKTRLTSRVQFFKLIFKVKYFFGGICERLKCCFEWRGLMYEEGGTWFVGGLGPPPPHPPPIARRLFIGFQNLPQPKSHFQRPKLKCQWPFCYNKCVSWQN